MKTLFALLVLAVLALIGSRFGRSWLRKGGGKLNVVLASGASYLLLGLALGPLGFNLLTPGVLDAMLPLVGFALAWVGVLLGTQMRRQELRMFPPRFWSMLGVIIVVPLAVVGGGLLVVERLWVPLEQDWLSLTLLAGASVALSLPTFGFANWRGAPEPVVQLLLSLGSFTTLLPVLAALGFSITWLVRIGGIPPWQASAVALALGAGGGLMLWLMMRMTAPRREQFLLLLGVVTIGGGLAAMFHLSPLGVGFLAGAVYANTGYRGRSWSIERLGRFERPIFLGLLLVAGARMNGEAWGLIVAMVMTYLALHVGAKFAAGWLLAKLLPRGGAGYDFGAALVPQGAVGLIVVVEGLVLYPEWISATLLAVLVLSFLVLEAAAPFAVSGLTGDPRRAES